MIPTIAEGAYTLDREAEFVTIHIGRVVLTVSVSCEGSVGVDAWETAHPENTQARDGLYVSWQDLREE